MNQERLKEILEGMAGTSIAVMGDFCLDAYWMIDPTAAEISLETGKLTRPVRQQYYTLGGASNVVNNLAAMKVKSVFALGVIGNDLFGRELTRLLSETGVNTEGLLKQDRQWDTPVFAKPHQEEEEQRRIDFGMFNVLEPETGQELIKRLEKILSLVQAVVINQQVVNSIYTENLVGEINRIIAAHPEKLFVVDSRHKSGVFRKAYLKINQAEAARLAGADRRGKEFFAIEELRKYASKIKEKTSAEAIFITRAERGILAYDGRETYEILGIQTLKRTDPVGAGDTAVAAIAASLACGAEVNEAAQVANFASAVTVRKLFQCGTASPEEIRQAGADPDYIYNPELAEDLHRASYLEGTEIEIINSRLQTGHIEHVIFDHDGTISTLRQGWEQIMEEVMVKSILGGSYSKADEGLHHRVVSRVKEYIDKSTGIQTIVQMQHLAEMVREFGCVPPDKIRDKFGYKETYNRALMEMVDKRIDKFRSGEMNVDDFTIKGAVNFLETLYKRGIKLYLASGTDQADVSNEAEILGYASFFEGRLYGAIADINKYSKKMVVDRILKENNLRGIQLACFGDGPVELRETGKRGGITIGVASDEIQRRGLNLEKRTRLIKAGADIIIPDFSQSPALLKFLKIAT